MSRFCPKCGLGSDDTAAFCRGCGGDLRAVDWGGDPPAGAVPPTGPCPSPPPNPSLPVPPTPGLPPPSASGFSASPASGLPPPPASGLPRPPAPGYPPASDGAPGYGFGDLPPSIPNHLVWAILSTILCCLPLGIVSIVYGAKVNTHLFRGDISAAQRSSRLARNWAIASIAVFAAVVVIGFLFYIAVAVGGIRALGWLHS